MNPIVHWTAVYTSANCEKKVILVLKKKRLPYYYPVNQVLLEGDFGKKIIETALLPRIIFVQLPINMTATTLLQLRGVISLMYWQQWPAIFPAAEVEQLRHFLATHQTVELSKVRLQPHGIPAKMNDYPTADQVYNIVLPSMGLSLHAKGRLNGSVKLIRKIFPRYSTADNLAYMLGFKDVGS